MGVDKSDLAKVRLPFRVLAGFIFFLSICSIFLIIFLAITEPYDHFIFVISGVVGLMGYISGCITLTGYAPKFLLFSHGASNGL